MMKSLRVFSIKNTEILLHPATLLYTGYACLCGHGLFMLLSTLSIILHEVAHAVASALLGYMPASLELTPLGAVMRLEDETKIPHLKRIIILLAGPSATLALCFSALTTTNVHWLTQDVGYCLFIANLSILLLNLLPVLPLDGGRILAQLLSFLCPAHIVSKIMQGIGSIMGLTLIGLNIFSAWKYGIWNLSLAFAGCCMLYTSCVATTTHAAAELRAFVDRKIRLERQGSLKSVTYQVLHIYPLRKIIKELPQRKAALYYCIEAGSMRWLGTFSEQDAISAYLNSPAATCAEALRLCQKCGKTSTNRTK